MLHTGGVHVASTPPCPSPYRGYAPRLLGLDNRPPSAHVLVRPPSAAPARLIQFLVVLAGRGWRGRSQVAPRTFFGRLARGMVGAGRSGLGSIRDRGRRGGWLERGARRNRWGIGDDEDAGPGQCQGGG